LQASRLPAIPDFEHIVLILLENEYFQDIIGNPQLAHLNALAKKNVLLTNYFAVSHPSLPNYLALVSGSTQNITKDCLDCFVNQPNLADEIEASGRTWKSYQESMPAPCFIGDSFPYVQMLNPFLYFDSIRLNKTRCDQSIVPLTQLDNDLSASSLPNFALIMPDMCDSGHDCDPVKADNWVDGVVAKLQAAPAFGQNSLIVITFDEGTEHGSTDINQTSANFHGQIATVLISPKARQGFTDASSYTHYSLLKTVLEAWNLPALGQTAKDTVPAILAPWSTTPGE
jgi:phospholipase C